VQLSLIGTSPASSAAAMPASISSSDAKRISFLSRSGWSVSTWMLRRFSPASRSGFASRGSRIPFVVIARSSTPGTAAIRSVISTISGRSVGSPPVSRNLWNPTATAARTTVSISAAVSSSGDGTKLSPRNGMQ